MAYYGTQPSLAVTTDFAKDVSISTSDGTITDVSLGGNLSVTLSWNGLNVSPVQADITINVKSDDAGATSLKQLVGTGKFNLTDNTLSGSETVTDTGFGTAPFSIIDAHGNLSASNFESSTNGATNDTTVTLQAVATIYDTDGNSIEKKNTSTDSYVVSVTNTSSTSSTSGTADTQVSG